MASFPKLTGTAAKIPLSLNPENDQLIYYDAVAEGNEKVIPVDRLSTEQQQELVIARIKAQPHFFQVDLNGNQLTSQELIKQIKEGKESGLHYVNTVIDYLRDFLPQFEKGED